MAIAVDDRQLHSPGLPTDSIPELSDVNSALNRAAEQHALRVDRSQVATHLQVPLELPDREGVNAVGISDAIGSYDQVASETVAAMPGAGAISLAEKIKLATETAQIMKHHATGVDGSERALAEEQDLKQAQEQPHTPTIEEAIENHGLITAETEAQSYPPAAIPVAIEEDSFEGLRLSAAGVVPGTDPDDMATRRAFAGAVAQELGLGVPPAELRERKALELASANRQGELLAALGLELAPRGIDLNHTPNDAERELVAA